MLDESSSPSTQSRDEQRDEEVIEMASTSTQSGEEEDDAEEEVGDNDESMPIIEEVEDSSRTTPTQSRNEERGERVHRDTEEVEDGNEVKSLPIVEEVDDPPSGALQVAAPLGMVQGMQPLASLMQNLPSNANVTFNLNVSNVQHIQKQSRKFYTVSVNI